MRIGRSVPATAPFPDPLGLWVSVTGYHFLSSAAQKEGDRLTDRWLSGWDKGRRGNTGEVEGGSRGITRARVHSADERRHVGRELGERGALKGRRGGDDCVCLCGALLALERFHAPISNETHRARRTRAAVMQPRWPGIVLAQLPARIR